MKYIYTYVVLFLSTTLFLTAQAEPMQKQYGVKQEKMAHRHKVKQAIKNSIAIGVIPATIPLAQFLRAYCVSDQIQFIPGMIDPQEHVPSQAEFIICRLWNEEGRKSIRWFFGGSAIALVVQGLWHVCTNASDPETLPE